MLLEVTRALNLLTSVIGGRLSVKREKVTKIELGCLEKLDLANVDLCFLLVYVCPKTMRPSSCPHSGVYTYILQWVDTLGALLDLAANHFRDQLGGELAEGAGRSLALHNIRHLLPDCTDLRRLRIGGLLDLVRSPLRKGDAEESEEVVVGGLDNHVGLDESLPFANERAQLVRSEVESVEVGEAVLALNLVNSQLDLAEGVVLILLEIGEGDLEDTALERIVGVLETSGAVHKGLADTAARVSYPIMLCSALRPARARVHGTRTRVEG